MTDESMKLAHAVNLLVPDLLLAGLQSGRSIEGSEQSNDAVKRFRKVLSQRPEGLDQDALTFAVARWAGDLIDKLAIDAGHDPVDVIEHSRSTYLSSFPEG